MAIQQANTYRVTVYQTTDLPVNNPMGTFITVIAQNMAAVQAIVQQAFPNFIRMDGPVLHTGGAYTTMTGS